MHKPASSKKRRYAKLAWLASSRYRQSVVLFSIPSFFLTPFYFSR
jgi:hypothetical protein